MTANLSRFSEGYSDYETSPEILAAIEEIAGMPLPRDHALDEFGDLVENGATWLWENMGDDDEGVEDRAWELASDDKTELRWGKYTLTRPQHAE